MDLPDIDPALVAAFWHRFLAASGAEPQPVPALVEPFGDSAEMADELLELVLHGPKRATAGALADYVHRGETPPRPGQLSIATDGSGRPRVVLRTTEVRIGPLTSVDDRFAWDEGEGDRTRADWLRSHTAFFQRNLPAIGQVFTPEMETVFERFEVVYTEPP